MVVEFRIDAKITTIYIRHLSAELLKNTENDKGSQGEGMKHPNIV